VNANPGVCRLLRSPSQGDTFNMAFDEALLISALEQKQASLRFYGWSEPTVSLGYFQPYTDRLKFERLRELKWVRRQTGGATIVHHRELTYALALPSGAPWHTGESWLCRFHHIVVDALKTLGVPSKAVVCGEEKKLGDVLCFLDQTPGDLVIDGHKVLGSAQRRPHGALLQHGSLLLEMSPHTPELPGIAELSGKTLAFEDVREAIVAEIRQATGWAFEEAVPSATESENARRLASTKYGHRDWNEKR
jgi:lipoyl(octanoyl) transferase